MSGPGVAGDRDAAMMDAARPRPPFGPSRRHRSVRHSRRSTPERIVKRFFSSFQPTQRCLVHSNEIFVTLLDDSVNRFDLLSFSSLLASRTKWFVHTFVMQIDKRIGKFDPLWKLERRDTWSIFAYQRISWIYYQTKVVMVWCCGMNSVASCFLFEWMEVVELKKWRTRGGRVLIRGLVSGFRVN